MKKFISTFKIILVFVIFTLIVFPSLVYAQNLKDAFSTGGNLGGVASQAGYSGDITVEVMIGKVVQAFLSVLGIIFLILTIYSGYTWMTAQGNETKVDKAKNTLTAAIIGLIIVLAAYALSYFVISALGEGTLISQ